MFLEVPISFDWSCYQKRNSLVFGGLSGLGGKVVNGSAVENAFKQKGHITYIQL